MHSLLARYARTSWRALLCAAAVLAAGCHHNNNNAGYGIGWVSLTDTAGDFSSYIVNVDSVTLTGAVVGVVTAVASAETVDFTKLKDISELWSAASIPNDTYKAASIVLDYTNANISVMVNGEPVKADVVTVGAVAPTTQTINIVFDREHPLVIVPTYAATDAQRLAINFDLAASNVVSLTAATPKVTIKPFMTIATSASDHKPIRIRGPLINSSIGEGTYTVYVRPFFDEVNSLGQLSIFSTPDTVYTLSGTTSVGAPGLTSLSHFSAGTTMTAAYTSYQPTPTPSAVAGKFTSSYVIGGSTLEDFYTRGLEGDVIQRSGNSLTLRGSTLQLNDGTSSYNNANALVLLGPATIVTAEDNTTLKGLNYHSISVGQHIIARGIYSLSATSVVTLDATGSSSTNTGSVRLQSTQLYGSLVSSGTGSLVLDLQNIEEWPASSYNFTGNGAAALTPASYAVSTGGAAIPSGLAAGGPVFVNGVTAPFGTAPPDFEAFTVNTEASEPATLEVLYTDKGSITPFTTFSASAIAINLSDANLESAAIRIGAETIDMKTLTASPRIEPVATPAPTAGLPDLFLPLFSIGTVATATPTTSSITVYNSFATFYDELAGTLASATPVLHLVAVGTFNRASNIFTATNIDVVN